MLQQMKYQKNVIDAQKKYADELAKGSQNLLGFKPEEIRSAIMLGAKENSIKPDIAQLIQKTQDGIDKQQKISEASQKNASKRVEADNEAQRERDRQANVFDRIAGGIDNLAEGLQNINAKDVGMGLLAPLGLIGGILVAFVGGFVKSIKDQIAAIKLATGTAFKGFKTIEPTQ